MIMKHIYFCLILAILMLFFDPKLYLGSKYPTSAKDQGTTKLNYVTNQGIPFMFEGFRYKQFTFETLVKCYDAGANVINYPVK